MYLEHSIADTALGPEPVREPLIQGGRFYRPELDALRFGAFCSVFLYHIIGTGIRPDALQRHGLSESVAQWASAVVVSGQFGLDLFFVLSAYLITELLQRELILTGKLDIRSFYIRRILRIWPLYFSFLVLSGFLFPRLFSFSHALPTSYVICFVLLAGNWICAARGYAGSSADPLWSVSLEEQFYLVWPCVVRFIGLARLRKAAMAMFVLALASRIVLMVGHAKYTAVWCNTFARLDTIACGILLAAWLKGKRPKLLWFTKSALVALAVSIPVIVERFAPVEGGAQPASVFLGYPAVALSCATLVAVSLSVRLDHLPKYLSASMIYLGRISYGLYVFHVFSISVANHLQFGGLGSLLMALAITILLAAISYRWLEQPFLRLKVRYTHIESRVCG
jgi:peptidoglycan/LPS O-acetylase OafA/YrhL